jgi:hypothetical protein
MRALRSCPPNTSVSPVCSEEILLDASKCGPVPNPFATDATFLRSKRVGDNYCRFLIPKLPECSFADWYLAVVFGENQMQKSRSLGCALEIDNSSGHDTAVVLKNPLVIDRNPDKMFSCFIRLISTAKGGSAKHAFLTTRLEAGFCILGVTTLSLRASAGFFHSGRARGAPAWVTLGDLGSKWVKPGGRGTPTRFGNRVIG